MKKLLTIIFSVSILIIVISACGQTNPKTSNQENIEQPKTIQQTVELTKLDSIEKAHNESVVASGDNITKAFVFLKGGDSTINLTANIRKDHRIFGYSAPDVKSERLLLLSVFTNDVENNPFGCKLGAYYDIGGIDQFTLKYISTTGNFIKTAATYKSNERLIIYFEKQWIEFE